MIKVVGFDYGGVIAGYHSSVFNSQMANILGVSVDDYAKIYRQYTSGQNKQVSGDVFRAVARYFGKPKAAKTMIAYAKAKPNTPDPAIIELFDDLRSENITLGLLTNASMARRQTLRKYKLDKYFEVIDISAETGLIKPARESYIHFANQFIAQPSEIAFVDDVESNLEVPSRLGWQTIYYESAAQLEESFKNLAILSA